MYFSVEPYVPISSLRYKCLSKLASMMKLSQPTATTNSTSSTSRSITNDAIPSSSPSQSNIALHLPIKVVQLIIDHIIQERIPIRFEAFCALISNGCHSLNFWALFRIHSASTGVLRPIFAILTERCNYLREFDAYLTDNQLMAVIKNWFGNNTLKGLQYLKYCPINSPEDLKAIFSACPNLIELRIPNWSTDNIPEEQLNSVFEELLQPTYSQIRNSLLKLQLSKSFSSTELFKLISLFPNLIQLECWRVYDLYRSIEFYNTFEATPDERDLNNEDVKIVTKIKEELKKTQLILPQLQVLIIYDQINTHQINKIVSVSPNLQELHFTLNSEDKNLNSIGKLKCLKKLSITSTSERDAIIENLSPVLAQIGHNLETLHFNKVEEFDVSVIARYCPNLKYFSIINSYKFRFSCDQDNLSKKNLSNEERENLKKPFKHLESLRIHNCMREDVAATILQHAVKIQHIQLYNCPIFEEQITKLMVNNPMKKLQILIIANGHLISKNFFDKLIQSFDKLCYAFIYDERWKES